MKNGIDVSSWQGNIEWATVRKYIDFAMIRGGYYNEVDKYANANISGCINNYIPYGIYWFSYALSRNDAKKEADTCLALLNGKKIKLPVAYDFEYESAKFCENKGVNVTKEYILDITNMFCETVKNAGYEPMVYCSLDYYNRYYKDNITNYKLWLAKWGQKEPDKNIPYNIWQCGTTNINGIIGDVDHNYYMDDIIAENPLTRAHEYYNDKYIRVAKECIIGKYNNGKNRKENIKKAGMDYNYIQGLVNHLIDDTKKIYMNKYIENVNAKYEILANDVIAGKYGNGNERKNNLNAIGKDYKYVQDLVNLIVNK